MSLRFAIKNTQQKAEVGNDGTIERYSGVSERFKRSSERAARTTKVNEKQEPIAWKFNTGLDEGQVQFFDWYNDKEKEAVKGTIKELAETIEKFYGGKEIVDATNYSFWKAERDVNRLSLTNGDIDTFFDTKFPAHALLYLSIISGAFIDLVAPTKEWAENHEILHYLVLESEDVEIDDINIIRSDAHAALTDLRKNADPEALFMLAWCTQYDTRSFSAYTKSTPQRDLINYHIQFIDGKLSPKKQWSKKPAEIFIDYYERWKGQQTKPAIMVEAYVKAGEYFNLFRSGDKKYTTSENVPLGNTVTETVKKLMKPGSGDELDRLREQVEEKWK